jgi:drug/metabolite transporter (DMT)-like permease
MTRKGALLFAAMCVLWGIPYLMIRIAVRELAPETLVFLRTGIAALLLMPFAAVRGQLRPLLCRWRPLVAFAVIEVSIPWVLLARAETRLTSSLTGLLLAAVPLVGAVTVTVTGERERQGGRRWIGLLVGLAGVAAILGLDVGRADTVAVTEIAGVVVCYALGPILLSRFLGDTPALGVIAASLCLSALAYAPFAALNWPDTMPSAHVIESVLGLALVCTALGFLGFFALVGEVGPVRATVIAYVNPAVAAAVGVVLLGEQVTAGMAGGFGLVLAGSVLVIGEAASDRPREAREDRNDRCSVTSPSAS